ncbi:MAG: phasin family protein [Alphaproteobacteria bacterium]|jgi:phasin family protein|nr:phasin family protein [Alphaproteobacteria bacterium]
MATKMKAAGDRMKDAAETMAMNGADAVKNGFEKAVKGYDQVLGFGKETVEAYLKAANVAGKGVETMQNEMYSFSKQSVEETLAVTRAVLGARTVHEAIEIQSDFAKSAFDTYVGQINRMNEIMLSTTKEAFEPIQGRIQAWAEVVQTARAA